MMYCMYMYMMMYVRTYACMYLGTYIFNMPEIVSGENTGMYSVHVYECGSIMTCVLLCISPTGKEVFPSANKSLFVQFKRVNQAPEAITDIVILSTVNKAKVPQGYKRLP